MKPERGNLAAGKNQLGTGYGVGRNWNANRSKEGKSAKGGTRPERLPQHGIPKKKKKNKRRHMGGGGQGLSSAWGGKQRYKRGGPGTWVRAKKDEKKNPRLEKKGGGGGDSGGTGERKSDKRKQSHGGGTSKDLADLKKRWRQSTEEGIGEIREQKKEREIIRKGNQEEKTLKRGVWGREATNKRGKSAVERKTNSSEGGEERKKKKKEMSAVNLGQKFGQMNRKRRNEA